MTKTRTIKIMLTSVILSIAAFTFQFTSATFQQLDHTEWMPQAIRIDNMIAEYWNTHYHTVEDKWRFYKFACKITTQLYYKYRDWFRKRWKYPPHTSMQQQIAELSCKRLSDYEKKERKITQPLRHILYR